MVDTIPPLCDARAAFLRKAARDNLLGRRLLPFCNLYEVEEAEIVPHTGHNQAAATQLQFTQTAHFNNRPVWEQKE